MLLRIVFENTKIEKSSFLLNLLSFMFSVFSRTKKNYKPNIFFFDFLVLLIFENIKQFLKKITFGFITRNINIYIYIYITK